MHSNPVLSRCLELVAEGLHPSAVRVSHAGPGRWECRVTLDDWCTNGEAGQNLPRHTIIVDPPPPGVGLTRWERFPDDVTCVDNASEEAIETWVREVAAAGKAIDFARFDSADGLDGYPSFLTKPMEWLKEPFRSRILARHRLPTGGGHG